MKRYESYRIVNSQWFESVPNNWDVMRLKNLTAYVSRGQTPLYTEDTSCTKVVNQAIFSRGFWNTKKIRYTTVDPIGNESVPQRGDVLLASTGGGVLGKVFNFNEAEKYVADSHVTIIRTLSGVSGRFLYYFLLVRYEAINSLLARGSTNQTELQEIALKNMPVPVPPRAEQDQIVRYLDWQVSKINRLIAAKKKQIALLSEHRQRKITDTVTHGLSLNVPHKDSGITWIGSIPAHWKCISLKRCAKVRTGITLGKQYPTGTKLINVPYLRVANVQNGFVEVETISTLLVTPEEAIQYQLPRGCVLMTEGGDRDKLGRGCVWNAEIAHCIHQNHIFAVITDNKRLQNKWLEYVSACDIGRTYFDITAIKTTNLACTNASKVLAFPIPLPPREEQEQITNELNRIVRRFNNVQSRLERQIDLLHELRTRLIADVITGQIDVRNREVPDYTIPETNTTLDNIEEDELNEE